MRNRSLTALAGGLAVLALLSGCSDTTAPPPVTAVSLDLQVETGAEVAVHCTATNTGDLGVSYWNCAIFLPNLTVTAADGTVMHLTDPNLLIDCIDIVTELRPGERVRSDATLDQAYDEEGNAFPFPAGSYTVRASFAYYPAGAESAVVLERSATVEVP